MAAERRVGPRSDPAPAAASAHHLPDDLVMDILGRLPFRSVARFRAVCKSWRAYIAHAFPPPPAIVSLHETDLATNRRVRTVVRFDLRTTGATDGRIAGAYAHPVSKRFHLLHVSSGGYYRMTENFYRVLTVGDRYDDDKGWRNVDHTGAAPAGTRTEIDHKHGPAILHGKRYGRSSASSRVRPSSVLPDGRGTEMSLCVFAVFAPPMTTDEMYMWVLQDYGDAKSWQLARRIGIQDMPQMLLLAEVVEVAADVDGGGQEIVLHVNGHVFAYSFTREVWSRTMILPTCWRPITHKEGDPQISFGRAARQLPVRDIDG
ncbi:hypothetical protein QOZ80_3BG0278690 [Eleusine coracana subsp. coracana]|nr:hypothetical protein QOZ80_3BG0278690 [Eleusine coracana subsp. coracana]